jgi:biopolymer transport protein ExbB
MRPNKCNNVTLSLVLIVIAPESAMANVPNSLLPQDLSPWGMFMNADIVVKAVMIGLAFASLVTWTVWLAKTIELARETAKAKKRVRMLEDGPSLTEAARLCGDDKDAVAQIICSAEREANLSGDDYSDGFRERAELRIERVQNAMARRIARGTGILATIGSTAPFVGLFGTVWGIMNSFIGISESKTTSLAVVAPGIAEALLATALGLVAAIPAVVIYNHLARSTSGYRALLGDAAAQVMLMISRDQSRRSATRAAAAFGCRAPRSRPWVRKLWVRNSDRASPMTISSNSTRSTSPRSST